jgi:hypothetical protein
MLSSQNSSKKETVLQALIRIRYNPDRKKYFLTQAEATVGKKAGYDTRSKAEKARLRLTLAR